MASFDLIGIIVDDMTTSLAFYRKLGLDIPPDADGEDHVEVTLPGGLRLAWDAAAMVKGFDPDWKRPTEGHRVGLAFKCDSAEEVDALHEELVASGVSSHKEPWDAFWGQRYAVVNDPDGNHIDLFA